MTGSGRTRTYTLHSISVSTGGVVVARGGSCVDIQTWTNTLIGNEGLIEAGGSTGVHDSARLQAGNDSRLKVWTTGRDWDSSFGFSIRFL